MASWYFAQVFNRRSKKGTSNRTASVIDDNKSDVSQSIEARVTADIVVSRDGELIHMDDDIYISKSPSISSTRSAQHSISVTINHMRYSIKDMSGRIDKSY